MDKEQRRDRVARTIEIAIESRRPQATATAVIGHHEIERIAGGLVDLDRCHQHDARPLGVQGVDRPAECRPCRGRLPGEELEFELVGRDDIGRRHRPVAHELGNARPYEDPAPDIADHRIAGVKRGRVGPLHPPGGIENGLPCRLGAHVTGEHGIACREHPALGDPLDEFGDDRGLEHLPAPGAVAGVVRELHGMDRPDLDAETLHREGRRGIADMAVGDMGLDGENVHGVPQTEKGASPAPFAVLIGFAAR